MTHGTDYPAAKPVSRDPPVKPARGWINWPIVLANAIYAAILTGQSLAGTGRATGNTAVIGAVLLVFVMLPSNLLRFRWARGRPIQTLARLRKPLGISAGIWFVAHAIVGIVEYFDLSESLLRQLLIGDMAIGLVATLVFIALLATSNDASVRLLGSNWKRLHRLVWFAVPLALAHTALSSARLHHLEPPDVLLFGTTIAFRLRVVRPRAPETFARTGRRVDARRSGRRGVGRRGPDLRRVLRYDRSLGPHERQAAGPSPEWWLRREDDGLRRDASSLGGEVRAPEKPRSPGSMDGAFPHRGVLVGDRRAHRPYRRPARRSSCRPGSREHGGRPVGRRRSAHDQAPVPRTSSIPAFSSVRTSRILPCCPRILSGPCYAHGDTLIFRSLKMPAKTGSRNSASPS